MFKFEEILSEIIEILPVKISTLAILGTVALIFSLILFILKAFALFKMSKTMNLKNAWLSFVPILSVIEFGRVSQKYVKKDGSNSAKFAVALPILYLLQTAFLVGFVYTFGNSIYEIVNSVAQVMVEESTLTKGIFSSLIYVLILFLVLFGIAFAYQITYYVALWRIYAIFNERNAALFTIFSIFFSFLIPVFLFVIKNKKPKLTFAERLGVDLEAIVE